MHACTQGNLSMQTTESFWRPKARASCHPIPPAGLYARWTSAPPLASHALFLDSRLNFLSPPPLLSPLSFSLSPSLHPSSHAHIAVYPSLSLPSCLSPSRGVDCCRAASASVRSSSRSASPGKTFGRSASRLMAPATLRRRAPRRRSTSASPPLPALLSWA